jgi:hypothetical protein
MMKYKDGGIFQDRDGMKAPQDIDGGSAKPKKPKKKPSRTKLPPLRPGQIDMPSDPDDGSVGMKKGGMAMVKKDGKMVPDFAADGKGKMAKGGVTKGMHRMPDGKMMKDSAHKDAKKDAPKMQQIAARAVKSHEKRMHAPKKMGTGGAVRGDGCAVKGKTKGRLV